MIYISGALQRTFTLFYPAPKGLQFSSELQALGEGVLLGLQNLVAKAITETGEEELMFK
jgi:hypothetical protein